MNISPLLAAGVQFIPVGDQLTVKGPDCVLTIEIVEEIRAHKAEILEAFRAGLPFLACGHPRTLQDRAHDAWWCPACRIWSDGAGDPLPKAPKPRGEIVENIEARSLLDDLRAAGCGFVLADNELRLTKLECISTALWLRFEAAGPDFVAIARIESEDRCGACLGT